MTELGNVRAMTIRSLSDEHLLALLSELESYRVAEKEGLIHQDFRLCGCMGPRPECKCMERSRLIKEAFDTIYGRL